MQADDDDSDKVAKKTFKRTVKALEESGELSLDADGLITLTKKGKKRKKSKEERDEGKASKKKKDKKKKKKKKKESTKEKDDNSTGSHEDTTTSKPHKTNAQHSSDDDDKNADSGTAENKNKPCKGNPQGITRLFLGNLPFAVDEASLGSFFKEQVTHIKWITDKETGKFYGSAFVEMQDSVAAADAVAMAGESLMGRPIKINFAAARPGDPWPPAQKVVTGGTTTSASSGEQQQQQSRRREMSEKPENCVKLFIGNLSYDIDDDTIAKFFANVDAEVKAVRWLHHIDSGDFKGCGFVEFWSTEACEKGATLNGKNLLGRPIRIDWTD